MKQYRFEKLMQLMPMAFHGDDYNDPRNHVLALIEGFNSNCAKKTAASHIKVADETMSAYLPTTTKWGGLPFLSFILRKPQPLGTDFNSCACVETSEINKNLENHSNFWLPADSPLCLFLGVMLHLEIQWGMMPMHEKKYSKEHGGTAGCTLRHIEATQYSGSDQPQRQKARYKK